jgi:hypothetical protein
MTTAEKIIRREIAARAMQALISNATASQLLCNLDPRYKEQPDGHCNFAEVVAINAVEFADALIRALKK